MVISCLDNQIKDKELFHLLGDRNNNSADLHLEEDARVVTIKHEGEVIARWSAAGATMKEIQDKATLYINYNDSNLDRKLIQFWQCHPRAKFNLDAIAGAIDVTKANIQERIKTLTEHGIVEEHHNVGSSPLYSLHCGNQPSDLFTKFTEFVYGASMQQPHKLQGETPLG